MPGSSDLRIITERLPFALDDAEAVNDMYAESVRTPSRRTTQLIEAWTYGYIYKYMSVKKATGDIRQASDMEDLISKAYKKTRKGRDSIKDPTKYAHWVSVIAKNTFLNYVNRNRVETTSIDDEEAPSIESIGAVTQIDENIGLRRGVLDRAINRLPPYLRKVANLYYFEDLTFSEIANRLNKSAATIRVYKSRVLKALRDDERLRHVMEAEGTPMEQHDKK